MEILKDKLIGKTVMSGEGCTIGIIKDSLIDNHTGEATSISVKPSKEIDTQSYKRNEQGDIIFPFDSVASVKDIVIIEKNLF